ncbi:MAG: hypothetical protein R3345_15585 [Fulvivirga sp.]|nr:hypothetical protein [Fulvivirga sp.]
MKLICTQNNKRKALLGFLLLFAYYSSLAQVYLIGKPDANPSSEYAIIWHSEGVSCETDSFRNDRRTNALGGGFVNNDAEIAYSPKNGKLYLYNGGKRVYEPYSRFHIYRSVFNFSDIGAIPSNTHGAVFDKNGILYIADENEFLRFDPFTGVGEILYKRRRGIDNYVPSSDLAFLKGELIGTAFDQQSKDTRTIIYKYPEGDWGNPVPLIDLDTIYNFKVFRDLSGEYLISFAGILPVSDYCDTSMVYALYGRYRHQLEMQADSIYYWYVDENRLEAVCEYDGYLDGVTSTTESLFSEPCIVYIDLDSNNSSGAWGQSYVDTVRCYLNSVAIADEDVVHVVEN